MIVDKTASMLAVGDVLSNNGATVEQVVPCGHGASVYLRARFDDGYTQVVTVPAETPIRTWVPDEKRSSGHIAFVPRASGGTWEYWERDGEIWRQDTSAPVMPDGYRSGRWYGTDRHLTRETIRAAAKAGTWENKVGVGS